VTKKAPAQNGGRAGANLKDRSIQVIGTFRKGTTNHLDGAAGVGAGPADGPGWVW
jgi:hypothetical protein